MSPLDAGVPARAGRALRGLAALLLLSAQAHAVWVVEPSLELTTGYDDNVRLDSDQEEDAIVSTAAAQARFRNLTEVSEVAGLIGASYLNYSNTDDERLDDEDAEFLSLLARRDAERASFGLQVDGRRSLILRQAEPIPDLLGGLEGDPAVDEGVEPGVGQDLDDPTLDDDIDVNATSEQVRRTNIRAEPFLAYRLGELTSIRAAYEYRERWFDDEGEVEGLRDTRSHEVSLLLGRQFTPRTTWAVTVGAARFTSELDETTDGTDGADEDDEEADNYTASIGFDHQFSELMSFGAEVGASRSEREATGEEETHVTYQVRIARDAPLSRISAHLERSTELSAFGGVVAADTVSLRYQRSLSERLEFGVGLYGYHTERLDDEAANRDERDYVSVEPRLTWRLSEAWNVGVTYRYRWTDRQEEGEFGGTADSNFASLFLTYQPLRRF